MYLNQDAGTMNPIEHGEVFVTDDGIETDEDLGHYERYLGKTYQPKLYDRRTDLQVCFGERKKIRI